MIYEKDKLGGNSIYNYNKKNKIPRNILNQGGKSSILMKL